MLVPLLNAEWGVPLAVPESCEVYTEMSWEKDKEI